MVLYARGRVIINTNPYPNMPFSTNDISSLFNGVRTIFPLKFNQLSISTIFAPFNTNEIDVWLNGYRVNPYQAEIKFPWLVEYDWYNGYKVKGSNLVLYNAPAPGDTASVIINKNASVIRPKRYPFASNTVALGD